jgi:hypothetical protein
LEIFREVFLCHVRERKRRKEGDNGDSMEEGYVLAWFSLLGNPHFSL